MLQSTMGQSAASCFIWALGLIRYSDDPRSYGSYRQHLFDVAPVGIKGVKSEVRRDRG